MKRRSEGDSSAVAPEILDATIGYLSAMAVVPAVVKLLISVRRSGEPTTL